MDAHSPTSRRYEIVDHQGDTVETCADLIEALQSCPEDGAIVDQLTGRTLTIEDMLYAAGRAAPGVAA